MVNDIVTFDEDIQDVADLPPYDKLINNPDLKLEPIDLDNYCRFLFISVLLHNRLCQHVPYYIKNTSTATIELL